MARWSRATARKRAFTLLLLAAVVFAPVGASVPVAASAGAPSSVVAAGSSFDTAASGTPAFDAASPLYAEASRALAQDTPALDNRSAIEAVQTQSADGVRIDPAVQSASGEVEVIVRLSEPVGSPGETPGESVDALKAHADATQAGIERFATAADGVVVEQRFWLTNAVRLRVDTGRVPLREIARVDGVTAIHENARIRVADARRSAVATGTTVAPETTSTVDATWGLDRINATEVWADEGTRGDGVRVAVLDTGVDADHPDVDLYTDNASDPTYPGGWVKVDADGTLNRSIAPRDFGEHGTHISGTVAAGNASGEHVGVAPDAELVHGAVLTDCDSYCSGTFSQIISGMEWAVENDADVISMSLGSGTESDALIDPVRNAESAGVVVVAAIGNGGEGSSGSPSNVHESLAVGAANTQDEVESFSGGEVVNRSDWNDPPSDWPDRWIVPGVVAPGVSVKSTVPGGGYEYWRGTSMATPHVSGTAALVLSANPALSSDDVRYVLRETARKPAGAPDETDTRYGDGVVDARAAVDAVTSSRLNGTVVGAAGGRGIGNVSVTVRDADTGEVIANATTDDRGRYAATIPARANVSITADASFDDATVTREVGLAEDLAGVSITVDNDVAVAGTVSEVGTGAPIENASVAGTWLSAATTGPEGGYETTAAPREATTELAAEISATGYDAETAAASIENASNVTVDAALAGNASVSARVVDAANGTGVANATLAAARGNVTYAATADSAGNVTIEAVPGDADYELSFAAPDYYDANRSVSVGDGADVALGEIPLEPRTTVAGNVSDAGLNESLANATVAVERNGSVVATATTGADGAYVAAIDGGTVNVTVDKAGFHANRTENLSVETGDHVTVDAALAAKNGSIEGTVVADDTGEALANATVRIARNGSTFATRRTDENGTFAVFEAPRGDYAVTVSLADFRQRTFDPFSVGPGQNRTETVALVPEPATVAGAVRDGNGDPLAGATVTATADGDPYVATTDANGTYSLSVPRGRYDLTWAKTAHETDETTLDLAANETVRGANASIAQLPVFFDVRSIDAPAAVERGGEVSVDAKIENLGTDNGTRVVAYRFDGRTVDEANVTIENGSSATASFSYRVPDDYAPGEYDHRAVANTSAAATVAVEEANRGGGGGSGGGGSGGGGGGGGSSPPPPSTHVQTIVDEGPGTLVRVRNGYADAPAVADFETTAGAVTLTGATVTFASDVARSDVRFAARESPSVEPPADPVTAAGYFTTGVEFGAADVAAVAVDIDVESSALPPDASTDDVQVYRRAGGEWTPVATEHAGGTVTATVAPDGEYAVAVDESTLDENPADGSDTDEQGDGDPASGGRSDVTDPDDRDATDGAGEGSATSDGSGGESAGESDGGEEESSASGDAAGDDGLSGFGPLTALLGLLGAAALARRGDR